MLDTAIECSIAQYIHTLLQSSSYFAHVMYGLQMPHTLCLHQCSQLSSQCHRLSVRRRCRGGKRVERSGGERGVGVVVSDEIVSVIA